MGGNRYYTHVIFFVVFVAVLSFAIVFFCVDSNFRTYANVSTVIHKNILYVAKPLPVCLVWTLPYIIKKLSVSLPWRYTQPMKELKTRSRDQNSRTELHGPKMAANNHRKTFKNNSKPRIFKERKYNKLVYGFKYSKKSNFEENYKEPIPNKLMTDKCQETKYYYFNTNMAGKVSFGDLSFKDLQLSITIDEIIINAVYFITLFVLCLSLLFINTSGCCNIGITVTDGSVGFKTMQTVTFSTLFHRSSDGLNAQFTIIISRSVNSHRNNGIRVLNVTPCSEEHGKLRKINGKDMFGWLCSPSRQWHHPDDVIAYPVFQFYRLASFRPLAYTEMPQSTFFIHLSSAGFYYLGIGTSVVCSGCRNTVDMTLVRSDPSEIKYHKEWCHFATATRQLGMDIASNGEDLGTKSQVIPNEALKSPSNCVLTGEVSAGGHVLGDTDDGIGMTPPDMSAEPLVIVSQTDNELQNVSAEETFRRATDLIESRYAGQLAPSGAKGCEPKQALSSTSSSVFTSASNLALPGRRDPQSNNMERHLSDVETPYCDIETFKSENSAYLDDRFQINRPSVRCEKNPGHMSSFPVSNLQLDDLPSKLRHKLLTEFLNACAQLVVKITVSRLSSTRPFGDQAKLAEDKPFRIGSGSVLHHPYHIGMRGSNPEYPDPKETITRLRQPGSIATNLKRLFIETSRNLIFNNEEAQSSTVEFMFDTTETLHGMNITGKSVIHSTQLGDFTSVLVCEVPEEFVTVLNKKREAVFQLAERLPASIKQAMTQHVFIISYPHGGEPMISHGDSTLIKYIISTEERCGRLIGVLEKINCYHSEQADQDKTRQTLLYTAATCDGALGAPVITFRKKSSNDPSGSQSEFELDIWMHYGFDTVHELYVSMMKACTLSDFPPQGTPLSSPTSVTTTSATATASRTTDQQTTLLHPLSTTLTTPAYPIYSSRQKRLESFTNWPSSHIHAPTHLASAGFFYAGYADCVRCFQCGLGLKSWKPGDDVIEEHERHRPSCPFLQAQINNSLTSRQHVAQVNNGQTRRPTVNNIVSSTVNNTVNNTVNHGETNQDAVSARNSGYETAAMLLRPEVNGSFEQHQQRETEVSDNGVLPQEVTELQRHQVADSERNQLMQEETRKQSKSLPVSLLERENKTLKLQMTCKICRNAPIKDLFLPCGDLYACSDCSQQLTHCPACQKLILATFTTYFS